MSIRPSLVPPPAGLGEGPQPTASGCYLVQVEATLACVRRLREACRLARAAQVPWLAIYLDPPQALVYSRLAERRLADNMRLVGHLQGELVCLWASDGPRAPALAALAKARGVTHLVVGPWERPRWWTRYHGPQLWDLARGTSSLVLHLVPAAAQFQEPLHPPVARTALNWRDLGKVGLLVALATGFAYLAWRFLSLGDVIMVYMLAIAFAATRFPRPASMLAALLSVLSLDYFFVEPRYSIELNDIQHIGTYGVMIGIGWLILGLVERNRAQTRLAQNREQHARTLYRMGAVLAEGGAVEVIHRQVEAYLRQELQVSALLLLCDAGGRLLDHPGLPADAAALAGAALARKEPLGHGTGVLPHQDWLMLPLAGAERTVGVLAFQVLPGAPLLELGFLLSLAMQISLALERAALAEERTEARIRVDHEQLRNTLLSSLSHDLRTPLGTIMGATSTLLDPGPELGPGDGKILLTTIQRAARRLLGMVNNLLEITRLESGLVQLKKEWVAIEEVVGSCLGRVEEQLAGRRVFVELPETWIPMDPVLFEQALSNILDNALKFSPAGTPIAIRGWVEGNVVRIRVEDEGPGIPDGEEELIFRKMYRGTASALAPGTGLGMAICRAIVQAHGGTITAGNRPGGGARIELALPTEDPAMATSSPDLAVDLAQDGAP